MPGLILLSSPSAPAHLLREVFRGTRGVEISEENFRSFVDRGDLDVLIVTRWMAHDRYGAEPPVGESRVLSTGEVSAPPFAVTTPGFPARLEFSDGGETARAVVTPALSVEEMVYVEFTKIFAAIEGFNASARERHIERIGCDLELLNLPSSTDAALARRELERLRDAYVEYLARSPGG